MRGILLIFFFFLEQERNDNFSSLVTIIDLIENRS